MEYPPVTSRIKPLSLQLANQIAAGEVVERPASVVKELLENAIDAQSSRIDIDIDRGGSSLIRITDDGVGINKDDLSLAVSRHATSKVSTLTELEKIISLGFRGEALASISAVSKLAIQSRQHEQQAWMINTGSDSDCADYQAQVQPVAHPDGTTIEVRDLFFNTPARRKFMRTVKTEFRHIDDIVKRIALSRFDIAFTLTHNKKRLRNLPKAMTEKAIAQRISQLFSREFLAHSHKVDFTSSHFSHMGAIRLWGWVSDPKWHRNQADWQYFYVNGRYIRDKLVNHALRQVYQEQLPADTYPAYLLYLEIEPEQVDVNVHPTKHEVRFRQTRLVHDFIYSALNQATAPEEMFAGSHEVVDKPGSKVGLPERGQDWLQTGKYANGYRSHARSQCQSSHYQVANQSIHKQKDIADQLDGLENLYRGGNNDTTQEKCSAELFGQSLGCLIPNYLLTHVISDEGKSQVAIIDVIRAQQFLLHHLYQPGQQTPLLIPQTVSLSVSEIQRLLMHQAELSEWGLEFTQLAEQTLLVREAPSMMNIPGCSCNVDDLVAHILLIFADNNEQSPSSRQDDLKVALIKSIGSGSLNPAQQQQLLSLLSGYVEAIKPELIGWDGDAIWKILDESGLNKMFKG